MFFRSTTTRHVRPRPALDGIAKARAAIGTVIFGQEKVVEEVMVSILSGGHGLLVGLPGLAKTKLVDTLGTVLGLESRRVQFTPDLMPADILGSEVLEESLDHRRAFRFVKGPIFTQLLMADEINRASPRTQSALLQAMQELHVTVAGERYDLPRPFHVLATQNPIEQEGTYPLPEAQLDRFLMQIDVLYPDRVSEKRVLIETTGDHEAVARAAMTADDLTGIQRLVRRLPVGDAVVEAILDLVRAARPGENDSPLTKLIAWGPGPRAAQALMLASRARALVDGRLSPSIDDVAALAPAGAETSHGADLRGAGRRRDRAGPRPTPDGTARLTAMAQARLLPDDARIAGQRHGHAALDLARRLPDLAVSAREVAASIMHGMHGRRRAGMGEAFWQFRPFTMGESASRIDWRRSARDDRTYVREREWEAAQTVWIWVDRSPSMAFVSDLALQPKLDRGLVLGLAAADLLVRGGERVALIGLTRPLASRNIVDQFAQRLATQGPDEAELPDPNPLPPRARALLIGDFLTDAEAVARSVAALGGSGARGHLVMIADPVEELFPFSGHVEFAAVDGPGKLRLGQAAALRDTYLAKLAAHRDRIASACRRQGWTFAVHRTDRPATEALLRLATLLGDGGTDFAGRG